MLAFIVGIFCGLIPGYHCIRWLLTKRATITRQVQLARMPNEDMAETDVYEPYEDVNLNTHMEITENVAYAQY